MEHAAQNRAGAAGTGEAGKGDSDPGMPEGQSVETFIGEYQISDTGVCDSLVQLFQQALEARLVAEGRIGDGTTVDHRFKKSTDFSLGDAGKLGSTAGPTLDAYYAELSGFINSYLEQTRILEHGGTFEFRHPPQIQWYKPGEGFYAWHIDGAHRQADRALVYTTYLNDVTEGGGTEFYHQRHVLMARKGKTAIFPAGLTHVHRGVVSHTQNKYLLTGWLYWT